MLDSFGGRLETEEAASIHSHEQTRAARIGALGNHQVAQENNKILDAENPKLRSPEFLLFFSHHGHCSEMLFPELNRGNFSVLYEVASAFQRLTVAAILP
jgi:hypothetical protein